MKSLSSLLFLVLICFAIQLKGQEIPQNVNVKKLSNEQVKKAKETLDQSGLSREAAIEVARQKGASEQQIQEMLNRMDGLDNQQSSMDDSQAVEEEGVEENTADEETTTTQKAAINTPRDTRFGAFLFRRSNVSFEPNPNLPTPKNYRINIGDQILIVIWGNSQASYQLNVNRNGQVIIPDIGPVNIAGLPFADAEQKLTGKLSTIYADMKGQKPSTFAQVDLGKMRSIKVNIIGEAQTPGSYTLPATASVFNALYLSGGPNNIGSFREIQLLRNNQLFKTIDIYKYLLGGDLSENIILQDEDIIFIPTALKQVQVDGAFKRTGQFELEENEKLPQLITYAGGYTDETYTHRMKLYRKTQEGMEIKDFTEDQISSIKLENGDRLIASKILDSYTNRVTISGSVLRPGEYELTNNFKLSELISRADSITPDAYLKGGHLIRYNDDLSTKLITFELKDILNGTQDIFLQPEDEIRIKSHFQLEEQETVRVSGQVNNPRSFPYMDGMTLRDVIYLADGFREGADSTAIEVSRRLGTEKEAEYGDTLRYTFYFSLDRKLNMDSPTGRFLIQPFDRISVPTAPGYLQPGEVHIQGEVIRAGEYALNTRGMRITDLLNKAGGLTPDAFPQGAIFRRNSEVLGSEVVGIELQEIINNPNSRNDLFLMNGDVLTIPKRLQTVKVSGNVLNPLSLTFEPGKSVLYYVDKAGGFDEDTRKRKVYVKYPNGTTASTHGFLFKDYPKVNAGTEIIVPRKPENNRPDQTGKWISITSALSSLAIAITAVLR